MNTAIIAEAEARAGRTMDRAAYQRFLPIVRRTAMCAARRVPGNVTVADLVGYGWVGLMEAFERSAADMPDQEFQDYALYRVRGAMLDCLRGLDPATRDLRRASGRVACTIRDLAQKLGREPDEGEIARSMEMELGGYQELLEKIAAAGMARLELLDLDAFEGEESRSEPIDAAVARRRLADAVAAAIETLPSNLLNVLTLHYQEGCTLRDIGTLLGIAESRVSQLHAEAIHRLRAALGRP